jgi:hypothetical protein
VQAYRLQTQLFSSPNYQWAGDPERDSSSFEGSDAPVIELMASPNNPTATIQEVPSNASGVVVYDYAYYWPHLTPITKAVTWLMSCSSPCQRSLAMPAPALGNPHLLSTQPLFLLIFLF